ncbi:MAG: zinc ribbon domain-containing protein [Peptostreptococcaceae bacterium]
MLSNEQSNTEKSYYNYCPKNGKKIGTIKRKSILKRVDEKFCLSCGAKIEDVSNYCKFCGALLSKVEHEKKAEVKREVSDYKLNKINIKEYISVIDFKGAILSSGLAIVFMVILMFTLNKISVSDAMDYYMYEDIMPSTFKSTIASIASLNLSRMIINIKAGFINVGQVGIAARVIISPLICILVMFITTNIFMKKEKVKNSVIINALGCGLIYAILILILEIIGSYTVSIDSTFVFSVKFDLFIGLMNSFVIGFIGAYMGINKKFKKNKNLNSYLFTKASITIILGFIITGLVSTIYIVFISKDYYSYASFKDIFYYYDTFIVMLFIILFLSVVGSWMFALANFATLSVFSVVEYNIFSIAQAFAPELVLLTIIPMIMLVFTGRRLKKKYIEDSLLPIGIFSGIYAVLMALFAYASTTTISVSSKVGEVYLNEVIYGIMEAFNYGGYGVVEDSMNQMYNQLTSGLQMGPKMFSLLISAFIFSFVFVYIGYKFKKVDSFRDETI